MNNTDLSKLEQLLRSLKQESETVPADTFRANARIRILNTIASPRPLRISWYQKPRILGYTFGAAIATVVLSVGTVYAAQSSLPNSKLYPLKVLSEQAALTISPTESLKTTVAGSIISRRIDEIEHAQKQGGQKEIDASITNLNDDVAELQKRKDISHDAIETILTKHRTFINTLKHRDEEDKKPDQTKESEREEPSRDTATPGVVPSAAPTPTSRPEIREPQVEGTSTTRHEDD